MCKMILRFHHLGANVMSRCVTEPLVKNGGNCLLPLQGEPELVAET